MKIFLLIVFVFISSALSIEEDSLRSKVLSVNAIKSNVEIIVDGILSESIWKENEPITNFTQIDPDEGTTPSEKTFAWVAYDNEALYIAARLFDSSPDSITARLSRRDVDTRSDLFGVFLDPYYDKRSGYYFGLNAAGTFYDGVLYNDSWDDDTWDGVWEGKVQIDDEGWTLEIKIPFSQLRFHKNPKNIWGINFRRDIARKNERNYLVYVPKNESGFVSRFFDLVGIENINPTGKIEILPYVTSRMEYTHPPLNHPFKNGREFIPGLGADLKMGVGTNLTLNATINPDFGQVEIDPAVINLSDVETFFSEKRPFFVQGSTIFGFGQGGARNYWGFNWSNPTFFYSRRIGRLPQGSTPDADFIDYPNATHILGAAKLTGKLGQNFNIGTIQSVTSSEYARIQTDGVRSETQVEPLTYYGIIRGQQEFNEGNQGLGFISTSAIRKFDNQSLRNDFNSRSFTGGLDGWVFLDDSKTWVFAGALGISNISGNEKRMINIQRNSQHYFQRPDISHAEVDSSRTSLTGYMGRFVVNKQKGNFFFNSALGIISPEFDLNDLGFLWRADVINMHIGAGYYWTETNHIFRYFEVGGALFRNMDFGGITNWEGIFNFGFMRFLNYYSINWNLAYNPETINTRLTRGGPMTINEPGYQINIDLASDDRKDWIGGFSTYTYFQENSSQYEFGVSLEIKPSSNISFSVNPFYNRNLAFAQWVKDVDDVYAVNTFNKRYIFANLDQRTVGAAIRLNWTFTPALSLQLYVQPLISSGNYHTFKELAAPKTFDFIVRSEATDENNNTYDPDGSGPADPVEIGNPDFNFKSLRGNAVLRWEFLPGSVFYLVWTQTRADFEEIGEFKFNRSFTRLLDTHPDNIFMAKFTYWFNI